ncbi:MAG: NADH-quinone oxidoreductase subunit H [Candidatus Omnitrophica bacterium]|nr:NADH-quinone oxidoreductase subunit H [Candidatus Omnitrophota bacterium]
MIEALFSILIFPGFLFVSIFGLIAEYIDRKLYARLQNRVGPPWFQTFADFIKLLGKEDIVPCDATVRMFNSAPLFALTAATATFLYIPIWKAQNIFSFNGDIIMILYLLTIPTLAFFIGGWYSTSLFSRIGSVRGVTQLFAYEVPLFMAILSAALLADTWSLKEMMLFYTRHPAYCLFNLAGFAVSLVALLGKLEKAPFDIPEAETEIVAGAFTEYSGKRLALLKLTLDIEMVAGSALLVAVFFPFSLMFYPALGFVVFIIEVLAVIALLALLRTVVARLRIDQMIDFCWKYLVPFALFQLLLNIILKGVLYR